MLDKSSTSVDDLFKIVSIDKVKKVKMTISLKDSTGAEISVKETVEKLTEYVDDKLKVNEDNSCRQQVFPLMTQAMVGGLYKLLGGNLTSVILSQDYIRYSLIHMMTVGFYLLKFIQNKNIKIHTIEEPLSQEDIDTYERINKAGNIAMTAISLGADSKQVIKEMLAQGLIKLEDLKEMGAEWAIKEDQKDPIDGKSN